MKLRIHFSFDDPIRFEGFDSSDSGNSLHFSLDDGKYPVTLYTDDSWGGIYSKYWFILEIDIPDPSPDVIEALRSRQHNDSLESFYRELYDLIVAVYRPLASYIRNIARQYWLEPVFHERRVIYGNYLQNHCHDSVWLDTDGTWQPLFFGLHDTKEVVYLEPNTVAEITFENQLVDDSEYPFGEDRVKAKPIDTQMWSELATFIQEGKEAPIITVLIANSLNHLETGNSRLAIIEAVIALEVSIHMFVPKLIAHIPGADVIDRDSLNALIKKMGFGPFSRLGLSTIKGIIGLADKDVGEVHRAVEVRNNIVHNSQMNIDRREAQRYVYAIEVVINKLRVWATK
jgi:hypothetical protein